MSDPSATDPLAAMREQSRQRFYNLWQLAKAGQEPEAGEDARLVQVMREHPEYYDVWAHAIEFGQEQIPADSVNPFMHAIMHTVVENQAAQNDPPEVRAVLEFKTLRGISRHDAVHEIANAFVELLWSVLHDRKPFDNDVYRRKLVKMLPRSKRNLPK